MKRQFVAVTPVLHRHNPLPPFVLDPPLPPFVLDPPLPPFVLDPPLPPFVLDPHLIRNQQCRCSYPLFRLLSSILT